MPKQYPQNAIDTCLTLYLKYGGKNFDAIEREMRKEWSSWSKQLLHTKGTGKDARLGWIDKYGFENALKIHLENKVENVLDDTNKLYQDIKAIRETLAKKAKDLEATASDLQNFAKYADLEIKARNLLDLSKSNLETFAEAFELIGEWLREIDPKIAAAYAKHGEKLIEKAEIHYGKAEEKDDN
jgi:hypothetical protein